MSRAVIDLIELVYGLYLWRRQLHIMSGFLMVAAKREEAMGTEAHNSPTSFAKMLKRRLEQEEKGRKQTKFTLEDEICRHLIKFDAAGERANTSEVRRKVKGLAMGRNCGTLADKVKQQFERLVRAHVLVEVDAPQEATTPAKSQLSKAAKTQAAEATSSESLPEAVSQDSVAAAASGGRAPKKAAKPPKIQHGGHSVQYYKRKSWDEVQASDEAKAEVKRLKCSEHDWETLPTHAL